jgi:hypothetical protein
MLTTATEARAGIPIRKRRKRKRERERERKREFLHRRKPEGKDVEKSELEMVDVFQF